ncbi:MAG: Fe-S protein assembly co-chaperone HscB [Achromobacter sp.]
MAADDYFSLFGLPRQFALDRDALESAWRLVAARVHPDRFATASAAEKRVAMQWAARANDAYRQLRDPLLRAKYLCESGGIDLKTETNTAMAPAFLMQQMEWREMLDDARDAKSADAFAALDTEIRDARAEMTRVLTDLIDVRGDLATAGEKVREWMFLDTFGRELERERPDH